jgi:hypothetical protein
MIIGISSLGEATPAPTRPPLPVAGSLEYPDDYDPLADSAACWASGTEQVIPGQSPLTSPHSPHQHHGSGSSSTSEEAAAGQPYT